MHIIALCAKLIAGGPARPEAVPPVLRTALALPARERFLAPLCKRLAPVLAGPRRPRERVLAAFLRADRGFRRALAHYRPTLSGFLPQPHMRPDAGAPEDWQVPAWTSIAQVAEALGCSSTDLPWLSGGFPSWTLPLGPRHHYRYRWQAKRSGGTRLIEEPKGWLKAMQRRLLGTVVNHIPVHPRAYAFVRGRSLQQAVVAHTGRYVVVRCDLENYFASIRGARIIGLFMTAGYPERIARLLAGLSCNRVPAALLHGRSDAHLLADWHLPQGAPASPALANACSYRLDCRLTGLAEAAGAGYSRYADDLLFSGDRRFARQLAGFLIRVAAIAYDEGFRLNHRKTRIMRAGARQHFAGLVLNAGVHCPRDERDRLEAILVNCERHGPASQNRAGVASFRAHLAGRIAWVAQHNADHAHRLSEIFARIAW